MYGNGLMRAEMRDGSTRELFRFTFAVAALCEVKGIGPKVASCALLFGYGRYDAFPVDVWIKKVIEKYFLVSPKNFTPDILGKYAGIAQQYLFYYERYIVSRDEK